MRKALVVGINDYPSAGLRGCVNDAAGMTAVLSTHSDGSPNFAVKQLVSPPDKLDRPGLRAAIERLFEGDSDIALLYFSGHGFIKNTGGYIVTTDFKKYDEGISMDDILLLASKSRAKERIIILDCCHAGAFGSPAINDIASAHLADGMTVLTASLSTESAIEVNGHGLFTSLVIDALQGGAADLRGEITPGSIYAYVDQALGPWEQRPIFKTNVSRFTSLRKVTPSVPLDVLRRLPEFFPQPQDEFKLDESFEFTSPKAKPENVSKLKALQKLESVNLVKPVGEEHMYFAAMKGKSCRLSALGAHYLRLIKEGKV